MRDGCVVTTDRDRVLRRERASRRRVLGCEAGRRLAARGRHAARLVVHARTPLVATRGLRAGRGRESVVRVTRKILRKALGGGGHCGHRSGGVVVEMAPGGGASADRPRGGVLVVLGLRVVAWGDDAAHLGVLRTRLGERELAGEHRDA